MNVARNWNRNVARLCGWSILLIAIMSAAGWGRVASAQALVDQAQSLRLVPADAAFYSASLRLKEQWDIFTGSRAYARLMEIPFVQSIKMYAEFQLRESPEPQFAMVREYLASDEGKEVAALCKEMVADEVFSYGSADIADAIALFTEVNNINRSAQFEAAISGQDPGQLMARRLFEWFDAHKEQLKLPDMVMGFRVRNRDRATRLLAFYEHELESLLVDRAPELAGRLRREQIAGHEFVTLKLDGSLLPWDEIRSDAADVDAEQFEKWKALANDKTVAIAMGIVDEFVILSLGDSTEHLANLAKAPLLNQNAAVARLNRHAGQRVVGVSYASQSFISKVNSPQRAMNDAVEMMAGMLKMAPISEELQTRLREDIRGFASAVIKYLPQPGELAAVGYLTPRGYEGYRYSSGTLPGADSTRPLVVLNHVGGNPMFAMAAHAGDTVQDYDTIVSGFKRLAGDIEEIVKQQAPPEVWAKYETFRGRWIELWQRLDRANREKLYPSMKANETAIVLDVASKSTQWFSAMPRSKEPLPMLEMGVVARVDDAALLRQGISEYWAVVQEALKLVHEMNPEQVPLVQLPAPEEKKLADGSLYSFPFPAEWGVDSQLAPNAGLTERVAAVSLFPAFTEQLLKAAPTTIDTSLELNRPAAIVAHFQFAKMIDAVRPWIAYGFAAATGQLSTDGGDEPGNAAQQAVMLQAGFILPQVNQLLDVLAAFRSYASVTYREDETWVTHSEVHLKDLE
jgi:hypothetical protein